MSKRHFEAIARIIRTQVEAIEQSGDPKSSQYSRTVASGIEFVARGLADAFASENPRFDRARFLQACRIAD